MLGGREAYVAGLRLRDKFGYRKTPVIVHPPVLLVIDAEVDLASTQPTKRD